MITIPPNTTIIGELRSSGRVCFEGHFDGAAEIDGILIITRSAGWKGRVSADKVVIEGSVDGDIVARELVEISAEATVNGTVTSPQIAIEQGGTVNGKIIMQAPEPVGLLDWKKESNAEQDKEKTETTEPMIKTG